MVIETLIENDLLTEILNTLNAVLDNIRDDTVSGREAYNKCADLEMRLYNQTYSAAVHTRKLVQCEIDGKPHVLMQYINSNEDKE